VITVYSMVRRLVLGGLLGLFVVLGCACSINAPLLTAATATADLKPVGTDAILRSTATPDGPVVTLERSSTHEVTPSAGTSAYSAPPNATVVLPPQGLYESCLPTDPRCLDRLTEMGTKGFSIVLNDGLRYASSADALRVYADHAQGLGMRIILPVKYSPEWDDDDSFLVREFPDLARECGCTDNESFLTYYVNSLKHHPAVWGYYMADEVHSEYHGGLKAYSDLVKSIDPDHPRLIVEEGTNDPMEIFFTFHSYMNDTTDVLAADYYPYGYIDTFGNVSRLTAASARMTQAWSEELHLKSAMVLQAFAWTQYYGLTNPLCFPWPICAPFPSYEQMKAQRDQAILGSRPEIILWFSYPDILKSHDPAGHWRDLVAAAFAPLPSPVPTATPRPQYCPVTWNCEDVGSPKLEGTQLLRGSAWTVEGSGWDIWSSMGEKADQFRYVWQELTADGDFSARATVQTNTDSRAKAGIMLRKTFDPVSPYYAIFVTPGSGIHVQCRYDYNQNPVDLTSVRKMPPVYLRITRTGTTCSAYTSTDGTDWMQIPDSTVQMGNLSGRVMAGLAVTSRNEDMLSSAEFDSVDIVSSNQ